MVEPLGDKEIQYLDQTCRQSTDPSAIAFYLSLHMGLILSECVALKFKDIDLENQVVHIRNEIRMGRVITLQKATSARDVPMTDEVVSFLQSRNLERYQPECYMFNHSETLLESTATVKWAFRKLAPELSHIDPTALRCTFIKKCLDTDLNAESIAVITGMDRSYLYKWYGKYIKADMDAIHRVTISAPNDNDATQNTEATEPPSRQLNLLILGAGSHGHNVQETAEKLGIFRKIRFLDETVVGEDILDAFENSKAYLSEYPCAFVAIGDNKRRRELAERLRREGFMLPHIIHPDATVSKNAVIGEGTIVMAQATVNACTIGEMCIIASNALVSFGAIVGDYSHIDCGGMVMKDADVPPMTFVDSGEIYK